MFPYTEQYTESKQYIQTKNLLYKIHQTCRTTFKKVSKRKTTEKLKQTHFDFVVYKFHNSNFVNVAYFGIFVYFDVEITARKQHGSPGFLYWMSDDVLSSQFSGTCCAETSNKLKVCLGARAQNVR